MKRLLTAVIAAATFSVAPNLLSAQQPASVPDAMPFDVPYGPSITAERASELVDLVIAEATRSPRDWKLAIAVVDPNGELVYFHKMDQTMIASVDLAIRKAQISALYRRPTQAFFDAMQTTAGAYVAALDPRMIAAPGGIPITINGQIVGAIGCSGATGAQDHVACTAAINALQ